MPTAAFICLLAAAVLEGASLFRRPTDRAPGRLTPILLAAAVLALLGFTVSRSLLIGFVALTGTYESLAFYAAALAGLALAYRLQKKLAVEPAVLFGTVFLAAVLLALASSPLIPKDARPPVPALRSYWLALHVSFAFAGEAFFALSFVSAAAFLLSKNEARREAFDRTTYAAIAVGYPVFTAGALLFGAIWAEQAWGRWWSWDPKETWALVTWLVYTLYLHARLVMRKKGKAAAWIAVAGFLCTLFTFFGVNYLLPGLHSYA